MSTLKLDAEKTLDFINCSFNFHLTSKNLSQDSKQLNSDIETSNELSVVESRDESYKEQQQSILFKDEPEMYPGMKKKTIKINFKEKLYK